MNLKNVIAVTFLVSSFSTQTFAEGWLNADGSGKERIVANGEKYAFVQARIDVDKSTCRGKVLLSTATEAHVAGPKVLAKATLIN
jgi:hypothetical protein